MFPHNLPCPLFACQSKLIEITQIKQKEKEIRILILGLDNAGKTTIVKRLVGEPIDTIEPTLGFQIRTLTTKPPYQIHLWDIGGQTSIRAYWRNYFERTDGLIWVIDAADVYRLQLCKQELLHILQQERLAGASVLIWANKQDVPGALTEHEIAKILALDSSPHFQNRHWQILSCSAVTNVGLENGMDWIVSDIASRIFMMA